MIYHNNEKCVQIVDAKITKKMLLNAAGYYC